MKTLSGSCAVFKVGDRAVVEIEGVRYACKVVKPYGVYQVDDEGERWGYIVKPCDSRQHLFVTAGQIRPARAGLGWRGHLLLVKGTTAQQQG